ncbi:MAG: hypothetical protein P0111_00895 [Nitrospira sp.]|nr:hypothetical protein [Nitrospira sp.]
MKLSPVPESVARTGLRTIKSVCIGSPDRELSDLQRRLLLGVQEHILKTGFVLEQLEWISPEELATTAIEQEFRERIIRGGIVAACIDGEMDTHAVARLERYGAALLADLGPIQTAWKLANKHLLLARIDIIRRSLPGVKIRQTVTSGGIAAAIKQFFPLAGVQLPDVTAKYKNLDQYATGTLGRAFTDYLHRNNFPYPGEKGAAPEIIVVHDCLHILGDYGTTATEEIEIAAFQAGCQFEDPIFGILFGLAQYHLNIQVAPVAPSQALQANPEKMIAAFARGCRVNRDMWRDFDPWDYFERPVEDIRRSLSVPQKDLSEPH